MKFVYSDGGRSKYYSATHVGDCVCRAICNATGKDYKEVYLELARRMKANGDKRSARNGVASKVAKKFLYDLGWDWVPTMEVGKGCTTHLRADELPSGRLILVLSKHYTCFEDGTIYDTYDCSREGDRCVYGYFAKSDRASKVKASKPTKAKAKRKPKTKTKERKAKPTCPEIEELVERSKDLMDMLDELLETLKGRK